MPLSRRSFQAALLLATLLFAAFAAQAEETPWYEVEIIVFAHAKESYSRSENWNQDLPPPEFATARAVSAAGSGRPFQAIDESRFRLQGEWNRLQSSGDYRPLLHMGWLQPGLAREKAVGVLVESGSAMASLGGAKPLSGVITVGLSRYLHLDTNLLYRKAVTPGEESGAAYVTYQLSESRRMRSREIHYLDHPMFGVIALITPLSR